MHARERVTPKHDQKGFTLMELIVTIGICAVFLSVFASVISASFLLRKSTYIIQASDFMREEIDSLRVLPFTELINQTNGPFLGISLTRGSWTVVTGDSPPSSPHSLALDNPVSSLQGETGMAVIPGNYKNNFDVTAKLRVDSSSPVGWGTGIAFRYRDSQNHYRALMRTGGLTVQKLVHGTPTTLLTVNTTYLTNVWHTLRIVANGTSISVYVNGSQVSGSPISDPAFSTGDIGVFSYGDAVINVDDISVTENANTETWNFDGEDVGTMPIDWQRFVYVDLPEGNGTLTISNYLGQSTIKQVTATVTWTEYGVPKSVSGSTLIAQ